MGQHRPTIYFVVCLALLSTAPAAAKVKSTSNWVASAVEPATGQKFLVLARFADDVAKRTFEDTLVAGLSKLGVTAMAAYQSLTPADLASEEAIVKKAGELGVTAGIAVDVTGQQTKTQAAPTVHASVGVPVSAGPFSLFLGTSVPLGGGGSTVRTTAVQGKLFVSSGKDPVWIGSYATDLKNGAEAEARSLADQILKQLKKAGFFPKP